MTDDVPDQTPAYHEDDLSQIPALLLLVGLGYEYLSPEEALKLRGGRESQVLLVDVLAAKLREINRVRYRGEELPFTESAIGEAIRQLRDIDQGDGLPPRTLPPSSGRARRTIRASARTSPSRVARTRESIGEVSAGLMLTTTG